MNLLMTIGPMLERRNSTKNNYYNWKETKMISTKRPRFRGCLRKSQGHDLLSKIQCSISNLKVKTIKNSNRIRSQDPLSKSGKNDYTIQAFSNLHLAENNLQQFELRRFSRPLWWPSWPPGLTTKCQWIRWITFDGWLDNWLY